MSYTPYGSQKDYEESNGIGEPKTLDEAAKELKKSINRLHKARTNFEKRYFESMMRYNKAEDGLPKRIVETEDWN